MNLDLSCIAGRNLKGYSHSGKEFDRFSKKKTKNKPPNKPKLKIRLKVQSHHHTPGHLSWENETCPHKTYT